MTFNNFEELVHTIENDLGEEFKNDFRQSRKSLAGLTNLPNNLLFSEFDSQKSEWVFNRGGKKEIQYHIFLREGKLGYGLAINSQRGSFNNDDPAKIANDFGNAFKNLSGKIYQILPNYSFIIGSENKLGFMEEGEFILFGNLIPVSNNTIQNDDYKQLLSDLSKQIEVYKLVYERKNLIARNRKQLSKQMESIQKQIKLLKYKKQIILQGPPGTGKTREAKLIAKEILGLNSTDDLKDNEQFKLIQFHPSYTYEDFVRGIVAESKGDRIEYKNVNKTIGKFAKVALDNFLDSKKIPEQISKESWVKNAYANFKESLQIELENVDTINIKEGTKPKITFVEDDALRINRYSNENDSVLIKDSDIINAYIGINLTNPIVKIKENVILSKSARSGMYYLYQNIVEKFKKFLEEENIVYTITNPTEKIDEKPYILIIDEINRANLSSVLGELIYALEYRGQALDSMYEVDGEQKIILPDNLYIIGTMNTADRSVGHIDYAIRRRFAFVDVLPEKLEDNDEIFINTSDFIDVAKLFIKVGEDQVLDFEKAENSDFLSDDFSAKDVALGHSYFIAEKKKISEDNKQEYFNMKMKYEVIPILNEYLKDGVFNEKATVKIKEIEQRFA